MSRFRLAVPLSIALTLVLAAAAPAGAQETNAFVMGGRPDVDDPWMKPRWSAGFGYEARYPSPSGLVFSARSLTLYTEVAADDEAVLDSVGAGTGTVRGGAGSVAEAGVDLKVGLGGRLLGAYGFGGLHWFREQRDAIIVESDVAEFERGGDRESGLGGSFGLGAELRFGEGQGLFAEWFRAGGSESGMMEIRGWRFGALWRW